MCRLSLYHSQAAQLVSQAVHLRLGCARAAWRTLKENNLRFIQPSSGLWARLGIVPLSLSDTRLALQVLIWAVEPAAMAGSEGSVAARRWTFS